MYIHTHPHIYIWSYAYAGIKRINILHTHASACNIALATSYINVRKIATVADGKEQQKQQPLVSAKESLGAAVALWRLQQSRRAVSGALGGKHTLCCLAPTRSPCSSSRSIANTAVRVCECGGPAAGIVAAKVPLKWCIKCNLRCATATNNTRNNCNTCYMHTYIHS